MDDEDNEVHADKHRSPLDLEELRFEVYVPLTPAQWEQRMRKLGQRLLEAIDEHREAAEDEAAAMSEYDEVFLTSHLYSLDEHPERTVGHHDSWAKAQALEKKRVLYAVSARRKALDKEMHSIRQLLHSLDINARVMGHVT